MVKNHTRFPHECDIIAQTTGIKLREGITKRKWKFMAFVIRRRRGLDMKVSQSQKNPFSVSAMLIGKFLQIRKVFATSSFLAEEFPETKYPYDMQSAWMNWKVYG